MTRKFLGTVLSITVVLGIVSCSSEISRVRDNEIEITVSQTEATKSNTSETENNIDPIAPDESETTASITEFVLVEDPEAEETSVLEASEEESAPIEDSVTETVTTTSEPRESENVEVPKEKKTPEPTPTPVPTATPVPKATPTPIPTNTPTPTPEPTPVPVDIDQSAKEHGYDIVVIDMGGGTTQKIYGYYVDMSGLDDKANEYRASIGLEKLPKDTNHVSEMKTRAAEITIAGQFYHKRPNGSAGTEANIVSGTDVSGCYQRLYDSKGHRAAWEDPYAKTIYSIGFRQMEYNETTGKWSEGTGATVQYIEYDF